MLMYAVFFGILGLAFPPFWLLAFLFLVGSIFSDVGKILIAIILFPFKLMGFFIPDGKDEAQVVEKQTVIEKQGSSADQLIKLAELLEKNLISQEDFQQQKAKILTHSSLESES